MSFCSKLNNGNKNKFILKMITVSYFFNFENKTKN